MDLMINMRTYHHGTWHSDASNSASNSLTHRHGSSHGNSLAGSNHDNNLFEKKRFRLVYEFSTTMMRTIE